MLAFRTLALRSQPCAEATRIRLVGSRHAGALGFAALSHTRHYGEPPGYETVNWLVIAAATAWLLKPEPAGVDGAFVAEFVTAGATTSDEPRYDLDMNAFSLVRTYRHGKGASYPDMNWEPKQSFSAVADFYSQHQDETEPTSQWRLPCCGCPCR